MPPKPFNEFMNGTSPGGPSTPRGRGGYGGRGGGRGGGGGYRGGGAGGGTPGSVKSFKTDYSNVPFDYAAVNRQQYTKMDGFAVAPYGGNTATPGTPYTPGGRGRGRGGRGGGGETYTPRGRGRGGLGSSTSSSAPSGQGAQQDSPGPSGYGTPITGLGFGKGKGRDVPGAGARTPVRESTVGRGIGTGEVIWGGRKGAPMFVKAGELFKDGEVDVITMDEDKAIHVETVPLSDPSAPQMLDLNNNTEIEILETLEQKVRSKPSKAKKAKGPPAPAAPIAEQAIDGGTEEVDMEDQAARDEIDMLLEAEPEAPSPTPAPIPASELETAPAPISEVPSAPEPIEVDDMPIPGLFLDTAPQQPVFESAATLYTTHLFAPVGAPSQPSKQDKGKGKHSSDEEEIVFRPRKYQQPRPIHVEVPPVPSAALPHVAPPAIAKAAYPQKAEKQSALPPSQAPIHAFVDPRAQKPVLPRKDKKAAKKEKKKNRGKGGKSNKLARDDFGVEDDIEWGSDGPPKRILRIEGVEEELQVIHRGWSKKDVDMDILRDYLEGTMLGAQHENDTDSEEEERMLGTEDKGKAKTVDKAVEPEVKKGKGKAVGPEKKKGKSKEEEDLRKGREREKNRLAGDWTQPAPVSAAESEGDGDEGDWEDEEGGGDDEDAGQDGREVIGDSDINDDGSDESSIVGDLQAIMDALDSEGEAEDDDDMFGGKNTWTSEDEGEWFIRNMEEALGGGGSGMSFGTSGKGKGKGKAAIFKSIEDGDFEMDLPTEPVKKGKKKAQGIPEALQAQWEADRQKKASKKEQRELERLIAEIEGTKSSKKKAKGSSKAQQAALAHLIPASASEVADMFDIDSDDERAQHIRGVGKMRKMMNLPSGPGQGGVGEIEIMVERVREFIRDPGQTTMSLHPMEKEGRQKMHILAECFGMKSSSKGKGKARFTIFIKTSRTGLHVDESTLERLISASSHSGGHFYKALYSKYGKIGGGGGGGGGKDKFKKGPGDRGTSGRAKEGDLVGEGADRIGVENMGHKLLSMMGWAEGGRIGRSDGGLSNPIVAVVKNTKSGLGA